jgi:hypothetical protein
MSFKKPFRAPPVKLGRHYRDKQQTAQQASVFRMLALAAGAGVAIGAGSVALDTDGQARIISTTKSIAVGAGLLRAREPQPGDFWGGCDDARSAGTAPIYSHEPGYRDDMDGDDDGIACEPIR